jgi:hypothetical protein
MLSLPTSSQDASSFYNLQEDPCKKCLHRYNSPQSSKLPANYQQTTSRLQKDNFAYTGGYTANLGSGAAFNLAFRG